MTQSSRAYKSVAGIKVDEQFFDYVNSELLPQSSLQQAVFWQGVSDLFYELAPLNKSLLEKREQLQSQINNWHLANKEIDAGVYRKFLEEIQYIVPQGEAFEIDNQNVDEEIATMAGPQLVVPVMNARFALNACNARWGSLYDALYGTDAIESNADLSSDYDPARGSKVIEYAREFLDASFPLQAGSFKEVKGFELDNKQLVVILENGEKTSLLQPAQFKGYSGQPFTNSSNKKGGLLLQNNGLHVDVVLDQNHPIGKNDPANISDLVLESALTTIMDCEDSVAAVDAEDKILVYRNWLGLMTGQLEESVTKNGKTFIRKMNPDRQYLNPEGNSFTLPGRSLMFVRNVGHLMTSPVILDKDGEQIPEGILDGIFTCLAALPDIYSSSDSAIRNSRTGSVYIVKPKMHGPEEVAFANTLFAKIESLLKLPANTLKMGIMDEERRTSVNLVECIRAAKSRVVFINTGFLDRTGDEIHTSMEAGPFAPKDKIKSMPWINAYETSNVAAGLCCGLKGKAQIGKGMWAMPDNMGAMLKAKIAQPKAGANTAWVPSPTAATLHAMHYHQVNVASEQEKLLNTSKIDIDTILQIPLLEKDQILDEKAIQNELENNAQGILGYVVRWIDQGIGCSKVPDINNTALMEDRATLRISSQHICNWLHHGICSAEQVESVLQAMAKIVDEQNKDDVNYKAMSEDLANSVAFNAARDLIFKGKEQPSGYTEPLLHQYRLNYKQSRPSH